MRGYLNESNGTPFKLLFNQEVGFINMTPTPFIRVDPITGARLEVATAEKDIHNRAAYAGLSGIPIEQVIAPTLNPLTPREIAERQEEVDRAWANIALDDAEAKELGIEVAELLLNRVRMTGSARRTH